MTALAGAAVVGALAASAVLALDAGDPDAAVAAEPAPTATAVAVVTAVPAPVDVHLVPQADGTAVVTWTNPQPQDGDRYLWGVVRAGADTRLELVDDTRVTVAPGSGQASGAADAAAADRTCVEVSIVRADRRASTRAAVGCTP